jgi:hypothetical protein
MKSNTWMHELQEIKNITEEFVIDNTGLLKELESLATAQDEVVTLLYSRRALEVIITELCVEKLCRERGTEPLKSIIERFYRDKIVPDYITTSMQNLNSIATYGAHPKEFDSRQVRTNIIELVTILNWYFKEKGYKTAKKAPVIPLITKTEEKTEPVESPVTKKITEKKFRPALYTIMGIAAIIIITILVYRSIQPAGQTGLKSNIENDTAASTQIKMTEHNPLKEKDTINPNLHTVTLPSKVEKNDNINTPLAENKTVISSTKNEPNLDLNELLKQATNKQLSFADRKSASIKMKSMFVKTAVISISMDSLLVDRLSVDDYISRLLTLSGLQVVINKQEKNSTGKITTMDVSETKVK